MFATKSYLVISSSSSRNSSISSSLIIVFIQGNVTIIDTSGFEDMEQRNVAEKMVCCLPTAFAFVLVVNVSSAGGLLDEKVYCILVNRNDVI